MIRLSDFPGTSYAVDQQETTELWLLISDSILPSDL
jgi:hypothetical protein